MNKFVVLLASFAISTTMGAPATAVESSKSLKLPALHHEEVHDEFGQYALRYVTAKGNVVSERGRLILSPDNDYVMIVEGEISYIGKDGKTYVTKYTAGLDRFDVKDEHFKTVRKPQAA